MENKLKGILLASNNEKLKSAIDRMNDYTVVEMVQQKEHVISQVRKYKPDILLYTEGLFSEIKLDSIPLLISIKQQFPDLRIVYLAGLVEMSDTLRIKCLGELVQAGIYDILHSKSVKPREIEDVLNSPKTQADVVYLLKYHDLSISNSPEILTQEFDATSDVCKNIIIFSSIKPGSGKSFISVNVAMAIAKFGKPRRDGRRPRVGIIEGDLQTLSVGTLLQVEDERYNLKEALTAVSKVVDEYGDFVATDEKALEVQDFVRRCFIPYVEENNLYALVGSQLSLGDLNKINSYQYFYLVQLMASEFDVIIVDTNSSLEHRTTGPLLQLANTCYYILDLDFNNIRNNLRYRQELDSLGVLGKVRYILNRDIPERIEGNFAEKLSYNSGNLDSSGFKLEAKIPMIDMTVMYNRTHQGRPVVLDKTEATLEARKELFKIANQIWPLDVLAELRMEEDGYNQKKKKRFFFF